MPLTDLDLKPFQKTTRKTIIYLPGLENFTRERMDVIYRHEINRQLALGGKYTLPTNHLHVILNVEEPDLFVPTIEALKGFDGYLVIQINRKPSKSWEAGSITNPNMDRMENIRQLNDNVKDHIPKLLFDEDFKPKHIVFVGDCHCQLLNFINNIMLVPQVPVIRPLRGFDQLDPKVDTE